MTTHDHVFVGEHDGHPRVWCQVEGCKTRNPAADPSDMPHVWMPMHFTEAIKGNYTQRGIMRENSEGRRQREVTEEGRKPHKTWGGFHA